MNYSMTDEVYAQMEFETRPFPVVCVLCGLVEIATEKALRGTGWLLTQECEACPNCIKRMEGYVGKSETNGGRMVSNTGQAQKAV